LETHKKDRKTLSPGFEIIERVVRAVIKAAADSVTKETLAKITKSYFFLPFE
jgi:hypothetical protein